jgi:undecaprenyl-diphosphatase
MRRLKNGIARLSPTIVASREFRILAPVVIVIGLLTLFIQLAGEVMEGDTHRFDSAILLAFRTTDLSDPIGPQWLEIAMTDLTSLGGYTVLMLFSLLAMGYLLLIRRPASAGLVLVSGIGGILLNKGLKIGFDRPRPDLVAHLAEVHSLSFPSGHAMLSAIMYLTLGVLIARSRTEPWLKAYILGCAIALSFLIGLSRVYLGVHWPTDVLAGWCLGGAWAILCLKMVAWWESSSPNR